MTDVNPESPAAFPVGTAALDPGTAPEAPRRAARLRKHPLVRIVAALAGFALGWRAFQAAHSLWASRHDSTPISSSVPTPAGEDAVSGNGVTLTFPVNWVNVPTNVYRPGSFVSQAPPKNYLRWLQGLTRHGVKHSNVVKITVDGHPATLMTATSDPAAGPLEHFAGTLGCPDPASDQVESCFGIRHDFLERLAVIPVGKTTLLAWARTSKAHPDEAFFAMFEKMLNSVRFR